MVLVVAPARRPRDIGAQRNLTGSIGDYYAVAIFDAEVPFPDELCRETKNPTSSASRVGQLSGVPIVRPLPDIIILEGEMRFFAS